jgi:hypothetical protein
MSISEKIKGILVTASIIASLSIAPAAIAQQVTPQPKQSPQQETGDFSNTELQQFVKANERAFVVQQESEKKMMGIIEEEKISLERFNEIAKAHQEQKAEEVQASKEEVEAFTKAAQRIVELQPEIHQNMVRAIEQDGLSVETFEKIMVAYQQDPTLQAKVQKLLEN